MVQINSKSLLTEWQRRFTTTPIEDPTDLSGLTLKQILDEVLRVAAASGRLQEAMAYLSVQETRLRDLRLRHGLSKLDETTCKPTIYLDAQQYGPWLADAIELSGGRPVSSMAGAEYYLGVTGHPESLTTRTEISPGPWVYDLIEELAEVVCR